MGEHLGAPKARGHVGSGGSGAGAERRCVFAWHDFGLQDEISQHFASLEMMNKVRHFIYDDQDTTFFIARELSDKNALQVDKDDSKKTEKEYSIITENEVVFCRQACVASL
ncbi:Dync1h1 [Symbiodinium sp. CCMP2592]|nr:Dync1h1 [Symbiodinium sp. CCMP2592]